MNTIALVVSGGLITALASIICQLLVNRDNREKRKAEEVERDAKRSTEEAVRDAKLDAKLQRIEERLDEHNHYASRIGEMEESLILMAQDIKYIKEGKLIS